MTNPLAGVGLRNLAFSVIKAITGEEDFRNQYVPLFEGLPPDGVEKFELLMQPGYVAYVLQWRYGLGADDVKSFKFEVDASHPLNAAELERRRWPQP